MRSLWALNKMMHMQHSVLCPAHAKCSMKVTNIIIIILLSQPSKHSRYLQGSEIEG